MRPEDFSFVLQVFMPFFNTSDVTNTDCCQNIFFSWET